MKKPRCEDCGAHLADALDVQLRICRECMRDRGFETADDVLYPTWESLKARKNKIK